MLNICIRIFNHYLTCCCCVCWNTFFQLICQPGRFQGLTEILSSVFYLPRFYQIYLEGSFLKLLTMSRICFLYHLTLGLFVCMSVSLLDGMLMEESELSFRFPLQQLARIRFGIWCSAQCKNYNKYLRNEWMKQ